MPDVPQYICFILMPLNRPSTKCFQYKRLYDETTRPLTTTKLISCKVLGWVESLFNILFVLLAHDVIVTKKKIKNFFQAEVANAGTRKQCFIFLCWSWVVSLTTSYIALYLYVSPLTEIAPCLEQALTICSSK